ncbi:MAG: PEP-CTERM sorting domain-containing protein [Acidobacteriota bacterium]|nr:PEP-CTERM sorting domain-containing protein [Acidobacteriota bacterium]
MKILHLASFVALGVLTPCLALAQCPAAGSALGCTTLITANADGTLTIAGVPANGTTYDGSDDQLVGLINNTSAPLSSITLSAPTLAIFGFEADGVDGYGAPGNAMDTTGYGGPDAYFTGISADTTSGVVNFVTPIAAGGQTYFSLEEAFTTGAITGTTGGGTGVTPEPSTFVLLGTGAAGLFTTLRRRLLS